MKKLISLLLSAALLLTVATGCAQTPTPADSASAAPSEAAPTASEPAGSAQQAEYKDFAADGTFKVAFVCKFLTSVWFAPKSEAMAQRAGELGVEYIGIDANDNEDTFMQGLQNAINQDVDGIILTPVNTAMLPAIVDMCKSAGVAYMTTDDGGIDADGNRVPHLGLDDYALGEASARAMVEAAKARNFTADPARVRVILCDYPAAESFHNRLVGGYDAVTKALPEIPEENYIWIDTVNGLVDNVVAKFSSAYQSVAATTDYWIILGGDEGAGAGTYPILEENGVDFSRVLLSTICGSDMLPTIMDESEVKCDSIYFSGILAAPSGVALVDIMYDLFENGTPIPEFTGYPENVVDGSNYKEFVTQLG